MVRCGSKNRHQKDKCLEEIRLCVQNTLTIIGSIIDIVRGHLYDHLMSTRISTLIENKVYHINSKYYEENGYRHDLDLLVILH